MACGSSTTRSLNGPIQVDPGRFRLEHSSNIEFATSVRSFAWLSRYRRLNTTFERSKEHLIAFIAIAFISILSRRMRRLVTDELCA